jgi:hypothetical protein
MKIFTAFAPEFALPNGFRHAASQKFRKGAKAGER